MLRSVLMHHPEVRWCHDYMGDAAPFPGHVGKRLAEWYTALDTDPDGGVAYAIHHFRYPPYTEAWIDNWAGLRRIHDRVVVLTRPNALARFLSERVANVTERLGLESNRNCSRPRTETPLQVHLRIEAFLRFRHDAMQSTAAVERMMYPCLSVAYDDLVYRWTPTMQIIYEFLGLSWNHPMPGTFKQESRPLSAIVRNWDRFTEEERRFLEREYAKGC